MLAAITVSIVDEAEVTCLSLHEVAGSSPIIRDFGVVITNPSSWDRTNQIVDWGRGCGQQQPPSTF